jgi:hypothetical protein
VRPEIVEDPGDGSEVSRSIVPAPSLGTPHCGVDAPQSHKRPALCPEMHRPEEEVLAVLSRRAFSRVEAQTRLAQEFVVEECVIVALQAADLSELDGAAEVCDQKENEGASVT